MRGILSMSVALLILAAGFVTVPPPASALTITRATVTRGVVQVRGKQAVPDATITWEGEAVTEAASNGRFRFDTTVLPKDCVGDVGDGVETVEAVVQFCGPVGPKGDQGDPGPQGPGFVVRDSNGTVVGMLAEPDAGDGKGRGSVIRAVNGVPVKFEITDAGFTQTFRDFPYLPFVSTDCSGLPALPSPGLVNAAWVHGTTAYYAVGPGSPEDVTTYGSFLRAVSDEDECANGFGGTFVPPDLCCTGGSVDPVGAPMSSFDLSTLGLVPPFRVEGP